MLNAKPLKTRQICLMFIAFLPVIKLFTLPGLMAQAAEQDMWLSALIALALDLITMFVILFTLRKEDTDFYGLLEDNFGRTGSLIILALFALCFFIKALLPVFEQQDFVTLTFYVTTPKSLMFLPFFLGAAYLAGLASGYWESKEDVLHNWQVDRIFEPDMDDKRRTELISGWKKAVSRVRDWAR